MINKNSLTINPSFKNKQTGATLMTVMVFLVLMTIVTVSATKVSILDVLVSGNDQQRVVAFQDTANNLTRFTQTDQLATALAVQAFRDGDQRFTPTDSTNEMTKILTNLVEKYPCERAGKGSSMGGAAPPCSLYDFQIRHQKTNTGVKDEHHRGGGKMVPNAGSKSSLI